MVTRRTFGTRLAASAIPGLGRVIPSRQQAAPPAQVVAPGSSSGTFRGRLVVVFGTGKNTGVFVYSPTPGTGNLIVSITSAAGTDPYGNVYLQGVTTYITSGGQTIAMGEGTSSAGAAGFFFSNITTPLLGDPGMVANLLAPTVQGSELFLTSGQSVAGATAALLELLDSKNTGITNGSIVLLSGQNALQGNANNFQPLTSGGLGGAQWPMSGASSDSTHFTITQAAFTRCTIQWPLNNDPRPLTTYRLTTWGLGTWGSTQQQLNFRGNITGGAGLGQIQIGALLMPVSTVFNFKVIQELQILTTGPSGTWEANIEAIVSAGAGTILSNSGTANSSVAGSRRGNGSVDTTNFSMWIEADWASTTGAPTLTTQGSLMERIGP